MSFGSPRLATQLLYRGTKDTVRAWNVTSHSCSFGPSCLFWGVRKFCNSRVEPPESVVASWNPFRDSGGRGSRAASGKVPPPAMGSLLLPFQRFPERSLQPWWQSFSQASQLLLKGVPVLSRPGRPSTARKIRVARFLRPPAPQMLLSSWTPVSGLGPKIFVLKER